MVAGTLVGRPVADIPACTLVADMQVGMLAGIQVCTLEAGKLGGSMEEDSMEEGMLVDSMQADMQEVGKLAGTLEAGKQVHMLAVGKRGCIVADIQADRAVRKQAGSKDR